MKEPGTDTTSNRPLTLEDKVDKIYRILGGDINGKRGLVQTVDEHEKILTDPQDGLVTNVATLKSQKNYIIGWVAGAVFAGAGAMWIVEHLK